MEYRIIDIEGLRRLSGNDEAFVTEILKLYKERASNDLDELKKAQENEDWNSVRFVVHRMRSASVSLGLKELTVLLKKVEMNLKKGVFTDLDKNLARIFEISNGAIKEAHRELKVTSA
jgi:HPt (histidine-containing phosphotransfer) domain-containing protein